MAFSISFLIRTQSLDFIDGVDEFDAYHLNEFDPYFNYRATDYLVTNGLTAYLDWHDDMTWYPNGRDVSRSQSALHYTAAATYPVLGMNSSLYHYTIIFPVIFGSLTAVIIFALVRVIGGTAAGLFAALFYSISLPIITRGILGWFKSEPLGLFYGLLGVYFFLSSIKSTNRYDVILRMVGAGIFMGFGLGSWGGIQFFILPLGIFIMALPFLRKDHKKQIWSIPIFVISLVASLLFFERPGLSFMTGLGGFAILGTTFFMIVCNLIQIFSAEAKRFRNSILFLAGTVISGISIIVLSFSTPLLGLPSYRYLNAINPFLTTAEPLVDSVAEHATTTLEQSFFFHSILMVFAAIGIWLLLQNRTKHRPHQDMTAFALIIGIFGVYISSAFIRLEVFASIAVIILGSLGVSILASSILRNNTSNLLDNKLPVTKILFIAGIAILLAVPLVYPEDNWVNAMKIPTSILNGGTPFNAVVPDWLYALEWIKTNTPTDSIIAAWWDYGYWITTMGERTTFIDNATISTVAIEKMARMFILAPDDAWVVLREMGANYVLVFIMAQELTADGTTKFYHLSGGGDESKKQWFIRIGGANETDYIHDDNISGTELYWTNTTIGQMTPYSPLLYYNPSTEEQSPTYIRGFVPIYVQDIKFPSDGDGPFKLAYSSPSYNNSSRVQFGVFIYEVNPDYKLEN